MPTKQAFPRTKFGKVFGHPIRVGLYARVSTHDQQTLPLQIRTMREYASKRNWTIAVQIKEVGSARRNASCAKHYSLLQDDVKSMSCWCGDWIDGVGPSQTWFLRSKNCNISVWVLFR